jgi:hypothetical protein
LFLGVAKEEKEAKLRFTALNNQHNLTKVVRMKSEQGLLSDYPHFYELRLEG